MTLQQQWDDYQKEVMPTNPVAGQVEQTREAFYAGAAAVFYGLQVERSDKEIDDHCLTTKKELEDFFRDFKARHNL